MGGGVGGGGAVVGVQIHVLFRGLAHSGPESFVCIQYMKLNQIKPWFRNFFEYFLLPSSLAVNVHAHVVIFVYPSYCSLSSRKQLVGSLAPRQNCKPSQHPCPQINTGCNIIILIPILVTCGEKAHNI